MSFLISYVPPFGGKRFSDTDANAMHPVSFHRLSIDLSLLCIFSVNKHVWHDTRVISLNNAHKHSFVTNKNDNHSSMTFGHASHDSISPSEPLLELSCKINCERQSISITSCQSCPHAFMNLLNITSPWKTAKVV